MLCANQILLSFIIYLRSNFSGLHYFKTDSVLSITDKLLMILLFGFILINPSLRADFNIEWFIYGQTACYFITLLLAIVLTMPLLKNLSYAISLGALKTIWLNSYPYVLVIFFMTIYARSDAFIIERISGASNAGH
jgi:O-antigen/teichoic acid export membrane protein